MPEGNGADLGAVLDEHLSSEFARHDADAAVETMSDDPYLNHVPVMTGGVGREQVRRFYRDNFVGVWPDDTEVTPISRTVGADHVVDELIVSFTHDRRIDFMFPGLEPTGRRVELPHAVIVGFEGGRIHHEHVYWDQASALVQLGLLDPTRLPVTGAEQAAKLRNPRGPSNEIFDRFGVAKP